jgi:hypothetical protein
MNKNYEIFEETGELPDFRPTEKQDDDVTVFNSFRLCKKALLTQVDNLILKTEKRLKQLLGYRKYVKSLLLKKVEDGEEEIVTERDWELLPDDVVEEHEVISK